MKLKNNNISHEYYVRMLNKSTKKPYAIRFKWIRAILWFASIFGNFASIFFAFFFFITLFTSSFVDVDGFGVKLGIVAFLGIFELLKRYIFDLFSLEYLKIGKRLFNKKMTSFIISTTVLIAASFFFSMNGAKKFMNKEEEIYVVKQDNINVQTDSIEIYYMNTFIKPIKIENNNYNEQISKLTTQIRTWNAENFNNMIAGLDANIKANNDKIKVYEAKMQQEIKEYKDQFIEEYERHQEENKMNIIWFLLISGVIEILILTGVYYNRHYEDATIKEYEKQVASTPNYKKWLKCQNILEMIYETGVEVDEQISSTNEILELISINELNMTKADVENSFKIFGHLKMYQRIGNKRVLKMNEEDAMEALKNHFKIK